MASSQLGPLLAQLKNTLHVSRIVSPLVIPVRWSRYSNLYKEPTISKEELSRPLDEGDERRYSPIKAARNEETTAASYDPVVHKFINIIMEHGKRKLARKIVERAFENIKLIQIEKYHKAKSEEAKADIELNPLMIFHQAVENCKPILVTQKVKRGGVIYQVPIPCKPNYQQFKSMNWLIESAMDKEDTVRIWDKLAYELIEASKNEGRSVRKKQELHRICEANRAYAHYRWG